MDEPNQGTRGWPSGSEPSLAPPSPGLEPTPRPAGDAGHPLDLRLWLLIVAVAGTVTLLLGQIELTLMIVLAGVYAIGHGADLRPEREAAYHAVAWVVPAGALAVFIALALSLIQSQVPALPRNVGLGAAALGALGSLLVAPRSVGETLARVLFRTPVTSHVLRLSARLAVIGLLFCVPAHLAFPIAAEQISSSGSSLVGPGSLWANLVGLTVLALGGVGFRVRRGADDTRKRLGLETLRLSHFTVIVLGVVVLVLANAGAEAVQKQWFPSLWASDQRVNEMIAGSLTRSDALLLGFSAGVGEELVLRGALQPKLGLLPTAALFAMLHVQYSWFGMAIIALLGLLLGTIRRWTSTSVAIGVHVLYDFVAVLALKGWAAP